jgi:hypothetical protein
MSWPYWVLMVMMFPAGAGVKWAVDRVWPPAPVYVAQHVPPPPPSARRVLEFEDTMDVLGAGYAAGQQARALTWDLSKRPWAMPDRPSPAAVDLQRPSDLVTYQEPLEEPQFLAAAPQQLPAGGSS